MFLNCIISKNICSRRPSYLLNNKINWKPITLNSENDFLKMTVYFTHDNNLLLTSNNFILYEMVWGLIFMIRGLTKMQKNVMSSSF